MHKLVIGKVMVIELHFSCHYFTSQGYSDNLVDVNIHSITIISSVQLK